MQGRSPHNRAEQRATILWEQSTWQQLRTLVPVGSNYTDEAEFKQHLAEWSLQPEQTHLCRLRKALPLVVGSRSTWRKPIDMHSPTWCQGSLTHAESPCFTYIVAPAPRNNVQYIKMLLLGYALAL